MKILNIKSLIAASYLLYLVGCNSTYQLNSEELSEFREQCYKLEHESFLYSLNQCTGKLNYCSGIQVYGIQDKFEDLKNRYAPSNESELIENKKLWEYRISRAALIGGSSGTKFLGSVKPKTNIKITSAYYVNDSTIGNFWYVQAKIVDGDHVGKIIELSSPHHLLPPAWVKKSSKNEGPVINSNFLSYCK